MKKRTIIITAMAATIYIGTTSFHGGSAADGSINRTGAAGTTANCAGGGCHTGTAPASQATIYIDSAGGVPVTKYTPGKTYTIRVVGKHSSNDEFGFQFAAVSGTGTSQIQAGTFGTSLPTDVAKTTLSGLDLIEHTDHIAAVTPADSFVRSFSWTAPSTSVGNITLYLSVNAVNGNHMADVNDVSSNTSKILMPYVVASSINNLSNNVKISAFPNPAINQVNVQLAGTYGEYSICVFDKLGRLIQCTTTIASPVNSVTTLHTTQWAQGTYIIVVENSFGRSIATIEKQ